METLLKIIASLIIIKMTWIACQPMICSFYYTKYILNKSDLNSLRKALKHFKDPFPMMDLANVLNKNKKFLDAFELYNDMVANYRGTVHKSGLYMFGSALLNNLGARKAALKLTNRVIHYSPDPESKPYKETLIVQDILRK